MTTLQGTLVLVQSEVRGSSILYWDDIVNVVVANGADFPEQGACLIADDPTPWLFSATRWDDGTAVLAIAGSPPNPAEGLVTLLGDDGAPVVDVWAHVATAGVDGATRCVVPHSLRPLLADGVHDVPVTIGVAGGVWQLLEVHARRGVVQPEGLSEQAWDQISAAGGNRIWHRTTDPDMAGEQVGDLWFRHDPTSWATVGLWTWDGSAWQPSPVEGTVLTNVDAGSITTGALQGINIYSPSIAAADRFEISGPMARVVRTIGEDERVTLSMGGPAEDDFSIYDQTTGERLAGLDPAGNLVGQEAWMKSVQVAGPLVVGDVEVLPLASNAARGLHKMQVLGTSSALKSLQFGSSSELGLLEVSWRALANRPYWVQFVGHVWSSAAGRLSLRARRTFSTGTAATPNNGSAQISELSLPVVSGLNPFSFRARVIPSNDEHQRVLITGRHETSGQYGYISSGDTYPAWLWVEDAGAYVGQGDAVVNHGGGTPHNGGGGVVPPDPPQERVEVWNAEWIRSWRGTGSGQQVADALQQGSYGGFQRYGMARFPASVQTTLSGSSISKLELYLENLSWYAYSGGRPRIGRHQLTSAPATPQTSGGSAFWAPSWSAGQSGWIELPADWRSRFAAGTGAGGATGITLGEGAGASDYGKFRYSTGAVRLRATFTK